MGGMHFDEQMLFPMANQDEFCEENDSVLVKVVEQLRTSSVSD